MDTTVGVLDVGINRPPLSMLLARKGAERGRLVPSLIDHRWYTRILTKLWLQVSLLCIWNCRGCYTSLTRLQCARVRSIQPDAYRNLTPAMLASPQKRYRMIIGARQNDLINYAFDKADLFSWSILEKQRFSIFLRWLFPEQVKFWHSC